MEAKLLVVSAAWDDLGTGNLLAVLWDTLVAAAALVNLVLLADLVSGTLWLSGALTWNGTDLVGGVASVSHAWLLLVCPALTVLTLAAITVNADTGLGSDNLCDWSDGCDGLDSV